MRINKLYGRKHENKGTMPDNVPKKLQGNLKKTSILKETEYQ